MHELDKPVDASPVGIGSHVQNHLEGWRAGAKTMYVEYDIEVKGKNEKKKYILGSSEEMQALIDGYPSPNIGNILEC